MKKKISTITFSVPKNSLKAASRLFKKLMNQKIRLIIVIFFIICSTLLNVLTPFYSIKVMDSLNELLKYNLENNIAFTIPWNHLGKELCIITILYVLLSVFNYIQSFLMAGVAEKLILTLREEISTKLHKLPLSFYDNNKPGEILSRVTSDLDKISETLQTGLLRFISAIGTLIGSFIFMFYFSFSLTSIYLAFALVSFIITKIVSSKNLKLASDRQEKLAHLTSLVEEHYTGRNVIKAYNNEENSIEMINKAIEEVAIANKKVDFLTNLVNPTIRLLSRLAQAVILLIASDHMVKGIMTFGVVQAYFQYMGMVGEPLTEFSFMINSLQSAFACGERTFEYLDEKEEIKDTPTPIHIKNAKGEVEFKHVYFGYSDNKILMKDISFKVKSGEKIAIVGLTGAGKTTLVNLLMRFYELNSGSILLDGININSLTRSELRAQFGMVLQDTWLFNGSIKDNIAYSKENATMEEIENAAKMANIDHFIRSSANGYDTILDNDASNISIGQRQLLTIARVFLVNPPLLILDEATSSVDTRTEIEIGKAMEKLMSGRTSFVIAHRLSTIKNADKILFMENGNIIEQGSHEELLSKGGAYASLYNSQFE